VLPVLVDGYVRSEGVWRLFSPSPVGSVGMLIVASFGLVVNVVSIRLLASGKDSSLNVKGAYLEVWADMLGSIGVIGGAITIMAMGWTWVDPVVAIAIGLWVLPRTWTLLRDTSHILLEGAPRGVILGDVRSAIEAVDGVESAHDLHVWVSGADQPSCTVHLLLSTDGDPERARGAVAEILEQRFQIHHSTVQIETQPCEDAGGDHR